MDKTIPGFAAFGVPTAVLAIAIAASGYAGAAALTRALASIGPGGMIGGLATLGIVGIGAQYFSEQGIDGTIKSVIAHRMEQGDDIESIRDTIRKLPISKSLKRELLEMTDRAQSN